MLHRLHLAIPKQIGQVFQVSRSRLVVVGHGWVVFEEEPKGLDMYMLVDALCNLGYVCTLPRAVYDKIHSFARTPVGKVPLIIPGGNVRMTLLSTFVSFTAVFGPGTMHFAANTVDCPSE